MTEPSTPSAPKCERCHDRLEPCRSLDGKGNVCEWKCCECDVDVPDVPDRKEEMQKLLEEMSAQISNRISFPLSYIEERAIISYIRTLEAKLEASERENKIMRETLESILPPAAVCWEAETENNCSCNYHKAQKALSSLPTLWQPNS